MESPKLTLSIESIDRMIVIQVLALNPIYEEWEHG